MCYKTWTMTTYSLNMRTSVPSSPIVTSLTYMTYGHTMLHLVDFLSTTSISPLKIILFPRQLSFSNFLFSQMISQKIPNLASPLGQVQNTPRPQKISFDVKFDNKYSFPNCPNCNIKLILNLIIISLPVVLLVLIHIVIM